MMHARQDDFAVETGRTAVGLGVGALRAAAGWLRRMAAAQAARRDGARLLALEDHLLRDIGVSRAEAERLVRGDGF